MTTFPIWNLDWKCRGLFTFAKLGIGVDVSTQYRDSVKSNYVDDRGILLDGLRVGVVFAVSGGDDVKDMVLVGFMD